MVVGSQQLAHTRGIAKVENWEVRKSHVRIKGAWAITPS